MPCAEDEDGESGETIENPHREREAVCELLKGRGAGRAIGVVLRAEEHGVPHGQAGHDELKPE